MKWLQESVRENGICRRQLNGCLHRTLSSTTEDIVQSSHMWRTLVSCSVESTVTNLQSTRFQIWRSRSSLPSLNIHIASIKVEAVYTLCSQKLEDLLHSLNLHPMFKRLLAKRPNSRPITFPSYHSHLHPN